MEYITNNEKETEAIGEQFGRRVKDGTVVAMYGDLGAGKTAFVRGMARGMGIDTRVSSPTFTIVNEYLGDRTLIHFDMYRLGSCTTIVPISDRQFKPKASTPMPWSTVSAAVTSVPDRLRPFSSQVKDTKMGLSDTLRTANTAARASGRVIMVSITNKSTPADASPAACSV